MPYPLHHLWSPLTGSWAFLPLGPPDAPLDVQIEPGPSPGILIISWLPVTIDAIGTSNGVRVTGYAIYADGQKVRPGAPYAGSSLCQAQRCQPLVLGICVVDVLMTQRAWALEAGGGIHWDPSHPAMGSPLARRISDIRQQFLC